MLLEGLLPGITHAEGSNKPPRVGLIASCSNLRYELPVLRRAKRAAKQPRPAERPIRTPTVHRLDQRLSPQDRELILDAYRRGESTRSISDRFGIARNSIDRLAQAAGLPRQVSRLTDQEQAEAIRLYVSGMSLQRVGERLGRSPGTIWILLKRKGIELRTPQGTQR